ncbi:MAG TPA: hypothetical protein VIE69_07435 [Methylophilaceae bacterium]|jgi:hypothetical protein
MKFLLSDWLKRMVIKSSSLPEARIVNLFVILEDLLEAPGIREQLLSGGLDAESHNDLKAFLLSMAVDAGLKEPNKLALQLCFILIGALNEEMRTPGCQAMARAGEAVSNLLSTAKSPRASRSRSFSAAVASIFVISGVLLVFMPSHNEQFAPRMVRRIPVANVALNTAAITPNPEKLVALYQMHDKIRAGQCSYPQALMLSEPQRAVFMNGVVNIDDLNTAKTNLEEVIQLYQKVDCYYPPAAMLL